MFQTRLAGHQRGPARSRRIDGQLDNPGIGRRTQADQESVATINRAIQVYPVIPGLTPLEQFDARARTRAARQLAQYQARVLPSLSSTWKTAGTAPEYIARPLPSHSRACRTASFTPAQGSPITQARALRISS